jgi:hypothetical protein
MPTHPSLIWQPSLISSSIDSAQAGHRSRTLPKPVIADVIADTVIADKSGVSHV